MEGEAIVFGPGRIYERAFDRGPWEDCPHAIRVRVFDRVREEESFGYYQSWKEEMRRRVTNWNVVTH